MSMNMQRSSLREEWGVTLQYTIMEDKLLICVKEVAADSPASKLLQVGDIINTINDWQVEKITQPEVAANLFRAAGNFVSLDITRWELYLAGIFPELCECDIIIKYIWFESLFLFGIPIVTLVTFEVNLNVYVLV